MNQPKTNPVPISPDPIVLPADKDKLARWQGDGLALLARLQESFGEMWLANDVLGVSPKTLPSSRFLQVGKLIGAAQEHFEAMPR